MKKFIARIRNFDGTDPITLQWADEISVFESVNSSDEGGSFSLPANDPKLALIDYTKWWEIWDGETNERLNYGPVHTIAEGPERWVISGPGRSQLLEDQIMTKHTFYYPVNRFIDDLRYENIAGEPRTVTWVYGYSHQPATSNPKYYGLSKRTGPNILDEKAPFTIQDQRLPTFHTSDSFWSGTDKADGITINLGQAVDISRVSLLFPWWGGYKRFTNRAYDFTLQYSTDAQNYTTIVTKDDNKVVTGDRYGGFYFYLKPEDENGIVGYEPLAEQIATDPLKAQYWRIDISDTHAWYSHGIGANELTDDWADQCTPPPVGSGHDPGSISWTELHPENDCHASIVEAGIYQEIIGKDKISNLIYQQVDNTSNQISYYHEPGGEENDQYLKISTLDGHTLTKYEPGNFMKRVRFSWAGAGSAFTKFFPDDPPKSMTSSVVAVLDDNNSLIYRTLLTSGTKNLTLPAYTSFIQIKGATGVTIENVDCWIGEANAFSVGNSISSSVHQGDYATLRFRGITCKVFVTVPQGKQPGAIDIALRGKPDAGSWSGWTGLGTFALPANVSNYKIFEITQEDALLEENTTYELRITNSSSSEVSTGNYVGLDAFAGYWESSWIEFNEDHERVYYNDESGAWNQIYDGRFSGGTMTKTNRFGAHMQFGFTGDRVQLFMAKGPNFGKATIYISQAGGPYSDIIEIPGAGSSIVRNLGKEDHATDPRLDGSSDIEHYIPRYLAFDSNWYWTDGMPWGIYNIHVRLLETEEYEAEINQSTDSLFDQPCIDCLNNEKKTINKYIYIDGVSAHCTSGLSAKFTNETHLSILKSIAEAIQHEWRITENGLFVQPRIGQDTDVIIKEGSQAVLTHDLTNDVSKVATLLYSSGADIDGLPLFSIVEDKKNKIIMGRTISRIQDFRSVADYFTLIAAARGELYKRRSPEERLTITYYGILPIDLGDSFIWVTKNKPDGRRLRLVKLTKTQSSNDGLSYSLECITWPPTL